MNENMFVKRGSVNLTNIYENWLKFTISPIGRGCLKKPSLLFFGAEVVSKVFNHRGNRG